MDTIHGVINCLLNTVASPPSPPKDSDVSMNPVGGGSERAALPPRGATAGSVPGGGASAGGGSSGAAGGGAGGGGGPDGGAQGGGISRTSGGGGGHRRAASRSALPDVDTATLLLNSVAANVAGNPYGAPSVSAAGAASSSTGGGLLGGGTGASSIGGGAGASVATPIKSGHRRQGSGGASVAALAASLVAGQSAHASPDTRSESGDWGGVLRLP